MVGIPVEAAQAVPVSLGEVAATMREEEEEEAPNLEVVGGVIVTLLLHDALMMMRMVKVTCSMASSRRACWNALTILTLEIQSLDCVSLCVELLPMELLPVSRRRTATTRAAFDAMMLFSTSPS